MSMNKQNLWIAFWPMWILANAIGWLLVTVLFIFPFWSLGVIMGIAFVLSVLQWLVLENYLGIDFMWVWLSTPTYGLFLFAIFFIRSDNSFLTDLLASIVCLAFLGLLQRSVLNYYVNNATVWVVVNPIASMAGLIISSALGNLLNYESPALLWSTLGIIYGCITGAALILLKRSEFRPAQLASSDNIEDR